MRFRHCNKSSNLLALAAIICMATSVPIQAANTSADKDIKEDIVSQLWWSPWVDEDEVTVSVEDRTATLTGTVDSWSERSKAAENTIEGGAVKVINKLDVDY